jgi:archaellum component FlaG (FlaF/FlaG flagellin family)
MNKKGVEVDAIVWWILAVVIAAVLLGIMIYNKETMGGAISKLRSLFSFGR